MYHNQPEAFIFDLDGTLYLGDKVIPGAQQSIKWVRKQGSKIRFVTNNPRFSQEFYYNKLNNLGISARMDEIVTSANVAAEYLKQNPKFGSVFVIGEEQLRKELQYEGVILTEQSNADTVLVVLTPHLHMKSL